MHPCCFIKSSFWEKLISVGITHNLSTIAAPTKIFSFKKICVHLSAIVVAVRGEAVWGAQVHHHVPLGPVIGGVSLEVSLMPHMVTSPSLGDHSHWPPPTSGTGSLQLKLTLHFRLKTRGGFLSFHCIHALLGVEKRRRRSDLCRYIWKCGFRHQSCKGDGKSTNFYSLLQFLLRTAVAVSDEWWWWWHVTRDTD